MKKSKKDRLFTAGLILMLLAGLVSLAVSRGKEAQKV